MKWSVAGKMSRARRTVCCSTGGHPYVEGVMGEHGPNGQNSCVTPSWNHGSSRSVLHL